MKSWEYRVVLWDAAIDADEREELNNCINEYGEEGWELVSVTTQVKSRSNIDSVVEEVKTSDTILYLKREI